MMSIYRLFRSSNTNATSSKQSSAPKTEGKEKGSPKNVVVKGLRAKEERLAGYLMARAATHQKVEGQDLKNLRVGQHSVQEVCDKLPLGRANVIQDVEKARDAHLPFRKFATHEMTMEMLRGRGPSGSEPTLTDFLRGSAGATLYAKTGTCGSFSAVNAPVQAANLSRMNDRRAVVAQASHNEVDHFWTEMLPKGMGEDGKPILHGRDVVMDGWSKERLAVLREDSHFARLDKDGKADHLTHLDFLNHRTGPVALREMLGYKARIDNSPRLQQVYKKKIGELLAAKATISSDSFWNETSIFHSDFQRRAGKALHPRTPSPEEGTSHQGAGHAVEKARRETLAGIQAVGVSRSLGSNILGAVAESPRIIAAAKAMFPDPR